MSKKVIKQQVKTNPYAKNLTKIVNVYVFMLLMVFPLFFTHFYFNILKSKYYFFCTMVIGCAVVLLGYCLNRGIPILPQRPFLRRIWDSLTLPDRAIIFFYISVLISTLLSDFKMQSFWGNEGRLTGLFYYTLVLVIYFIVTRMFRFDGKLIDGALIIGILVCLFGITDYFKMDLFHFKADLSARQMSIYVSTLGNINTYTVYVGIVLALAVILFATSTQWKKTVFYFISSIIFMFALIMGQSDNAYLSMAAIFGLSPLYLFRDTKGIRRYGISAAALFTVIQCVNLINRNFSDHVYGLTGVFKVITNLSVLPMMVIGLWILAAILFAVCRKERAVSKWVQYMWLGLIAACLLALVFALYDANFAGGAEKYGKLKNYLVFDDSWGTNRGFVWRVSMELFDGFSVPRKIFGYGPETFGILTNMYYYNEMVVKYRQIYDSAHNEYLQFLVTLGAAGVVTYLGFMFSSIFRMVKRGWDNPYVMAVVFAVAAYMTQAIVNINVPVVAPFLLTLLMIALAGCREE